MKLKKAACIAAGAAAAGIVGQYGLVWKMMHRTMVRSKTGFARIRKMSGTDWDRYEARIREGRAWLLEQNYEEVSVVSEDGLHLRGLYFPCGDSKKAALCVHGYTSEGLIDYALIARFYMEQGLNVLLVDNRAHGKSEGKYIGFGCLDRWDVRLWTEFLVKRIGEDARILMHGISMGGATVLMASGTKLPSQVKLIVSDCAFTSAWEVFSHVIQKRYHIPPYPMMFIYDQMSRHFAGYGLNECNAREEVKRSQIPTLFIHGNADSFVPCSMVYELYDACAAPKKLLVIPGSQHAEDYYKDPEAYEAAIREMMDAYLQPGEGL